MLSVKQGDIKYHFFSLWYDSTWDWTPVSRAIGEQLYPMGQGAEKSYVLVISSISLADNDTRFIRPKNPLSILQKDKWYNGYLDLVKEHQS